jgi:dTDP-4-dehydrorhamnose reductase
MKEQILVIGPGSLTGSRFIELAYQEFEIFGAGGQIDSVTKFLHGFQKLDLTSEEDVEMIIANFTGRFVINFAGATIVDEIEKSRPNDLGNKEELEKNLAYRVNVLGTRYLAQSCNKNDKRPIFISTGMVFDGENGPYVETDPVASDFDKLSWYAITKILAEQEIAISGIDSAIVRISYPYRSEFNGKTDFARTMLSLYDDFKSGKRESIYPIFADQTLTPTFIDDLAPALSLLINKQATGTFHLTSPETTTPYDFCIELLKQARGLEDPTEIIKKGSIINFQNTHPEIAKRPIKGGERSGNFTQLGFTPTSWRDGIKKAFT